MSFWTEDHASYPVEPFLLGEVQARGELIHDGPGIRDTAGPEAIEPGIRVLPHEYEDDHRGPHQDVAGRELTSEDGQRATFRPMPPLPINQSGGNKASSQIRIPISNLTKKQWLKMRDNDAKAKEIVWVPLGCYRLQRAKEQKRVLPAKEADDCLKLYLKKWGKRAPSCTLRPEFGGDESDTPPSLPSNQPPSQTIGIRERTPSPTPTRDHASTASLRVRNRLGPKTTSARERLGPKLTALNRLGPKTTDVSKPVDKTIGASKPVDKTRPRPSGPSAKILACRAAARAMAAKHQDPATQPSDKVMACKLAARKRQQERNWNAPRNPPKRRREETHGEQTGGVYIEFGGTSVQLRNRRQGETHGKRTGGIYVEFGGASIPLKNPYHDMVGYSIRQSLKKKDNE